MVLNILKSLISGEQKPAPHTATSTEVKAIEKDIEHVPRYPPLDEGVPMLGVELLLKSQKELISRIKIAFGLPEHEFQTHVMQAIRSYAEYVHLLPATKNEHHNNAGGLFRLGLEIGFYSLQMADGKIFSNKESNEKRRSLQPRWIYATFIAGLCEEIHRPITTMSVVSASGVQWPALTHPIIKWGQNALIDRYFIHWVEKDNAMQNQAWHSAAAYVLNHVIPTDSLDYLNHDDGALILTYMTASIMGSARNGDGNMIGEIVRSMRDKVIDNDIKSNPNYYGKLTLGSHLAPHIIDIMKSCISDGTWTINEKKSRVWYTFEGIFIVWEPAFNDICDVMKKRNMPGIPSSSHTLAELMLSSSLIDSNNGSMFWDLMLPSSGKINSAIKLVDTGIILAGIDELVPLDAPVTLANVNKQKQKTQVEPNVVTQIEDKPNHKTKPNEISKSSQAPEPEPEQPKPTVVAENKPPQEINNQVVDTKSPPIEKNKTTTEKVVKAPARSALLQNVLPDTKKLFNSLVSDFNKNTSEHPIFYVAKGLFISRNEFESHGIDHMKPMQEIVKNNWLIVDEQTQKMIHPIEKDGKKLQGVILKMDIAHELGFNKV